MPNAPFVNIFRSSLEYESGACYRLTRAWPLLVFPNVVVISSAACLTPPPPLPSPLLFAFVFVLYCCCSETSFHVFIVMASRRLESDRFFTKDFTPEVRCPNLTNQTSPCCPDWCRPLVDYCVFRAMCVHTPVQGLVRKPFILKRNDAAAPFAADTSSRPQKVYSQEGYDRVSNTEDIRDLLLRHFPDIANRIPKGQSAFKPWGVQS